MSAERCPHRNARGYGRCVLPPGHIPPGNGLGIWYEHQYDTLGSRGCFDVFERKRTSDSILDSCSNCGRDDAVDWFRVHDGFMWKCRWCNASRVAS